MSIVSEKEKVKQKEKQKQKAPGYYWTLVFYSTILTKFSHILNSAMSIIIHNPKRSSAVLVGRFIF